MATKEQYDFFRLLFEEEERRYGQLESRAKLYLSIIALFMAALTFRIDESQKAIALLGVPFWVLLVDAILLGLSLIFVVLSVSIRKYEGIADPQELVNGFGDEPPTNEAFFDDRIADYTVATNRNSAMNDRAARFLEVAGLLLALTMLFLMAMLVVGLAK